MSELAVLPPPEPAVVRETILARSIDVEQRVQAAYAATLGQAFPSGLVLASVGGFGRRELFPHSDVDVMLLTASEKGTPPRQAISAFLQMLWDSGLRPSHSVHSVAECVVEYAENAEFSISLLDHRILAGDEAVYKELDDKFLQFRNRRAAALSQQLATLAEGRRTKYQNTIYHLEPNVKESPGGLRDLQTVRWLQMLQPRSGIPDLEHAMAFLGGVRLRLHELNGRDHNVLSFDLQESLSEHPAVLMRDYYRYARVVDRAARTALEAIAEKPGTLLGRFHEWRSRLSTTEFTVSHDRVLLRTPQPPPDLSLFEFVARHDLRLAPDTIERLQGFVPEAGWPEWKRLLMLPRAAAGLRAMHESGVLAAALPEWRNIENLVIRDFYHRYTVDEHTIVAITALESVSDGRFSEIFSEIEDKSLVRFALIMHDIGKGSGRDHEIASMDIGRAVMERLGVSEAERDTIEFLILRHLDLSSVMSSRDLHDGTTARALADRVGTLERLKLLTMLTYADISAVNPQAMTPWKLEQLWQVYVLAHDELTKELETERIHDIAGVSPERAHFLEGLPTRYLRTHTSTEIDGHFVLAQQLATRDVAVEILHEHGVYGLTLLTKDRPALFSSVAGAISSFGLNILKVEAFSNASGIVVDTFTFADPHRTLELNPPEMDRLRGVVRKVVEGKQDADKLLRGRAKPFLSSRIKLRPRVTFKNDASQAATLVEIVAEDRPGLLYDLSRAISQAGCNIEVVMIDTEAHKAMDVFYLTYQGKKLHDSLEASLKSELLAACIGPR